MEKAKQDAQTVDDWANKNGTSTSSDAHGESGIPLVTMTLNSAESGDIILVTESKKFSCHKRVLCEHSLYFNAMFESGMRESRSEQVHLNDIDTEHFHQLLCYFYMGHLDLSTSNVEGMAEVSNLLQASDALKQCSDFLLKMVNDEQCLSLMQLSNYLMLSEVYDLSRRHALWHFTAVSQTEEFLLASLALVTDYLQDTHLNIDSEIDVFVAAAEWHSAQEQPCDVTDLTDFFGSIVNFNQMSSKDMAPLKELAVVLKNSALKNYVFALNEDVFTSLKRKSSGRRRESPRNGRILCMGAHQCSLVGCKDICRVAERETAPKGVLGFNPEDCKLELFAQLPESELSMDSGYRVCAIGHLVYMVGGEMSLGKGRWLTTVWCLDTIHQQWSQVGDLRQVRRHHGLCAGGSTLYLIGGIGRYRIRLSSMESFNTETGEWKDLPDMLYQETSPAVAQHHDNIYVFQNYVQVFNITSSAWSFIELSLRVPGIPFYAHPDPGRNAIFVCCYNSESVWLVDLSNHQNELVTNFTTRSNGAVFHKGRIFHFGFVDINDYSCGTLVECHDILEASHSEVGVLPGPILTLHFVTVPQFPRYSPSSSNSLS